MRSLRVWDPGSTIFNDLSLLTMMMVAMEMVVEKMDLRAATDDLANEILDKNMQFMTQFEELPTVPMVLHLPTTLLLMLPLNNLLKETVVMLDLLVELLEELLVVAMDFTENLMKSKQFLGLDVLAMMSRSPR